MIKAMPPVNLHKLILILTLFFVSLTYLSVLYASYQEQKQLLIKSTLAADRFYATMLAGTADNLITAFQYQLELHSNEFAAHINDVNYLNTHLISLHQTARKLDALQIVDAQGKVLASSSYQQVLPSSYDNTPVFKDITATQTPFVITSHLDSIGHEIINITQPLFDQSHHYLGYLNAMIFLQKDNVLYSVLVNHRNEQGAEIYLIDQQRHILNYHDSTKLGQVMDTSPVTDALSNDQTGTLVLTHDSKTILAGYAPVSRLGWGAIVQHPIDTPLTILCPLILSTALKTIPLLFISFIGIWFLSKQIAMPLWKLATQARALDHPNAKDDIAKIHAWYFEAAQLKESLLLGIERVDTKLDQLGRESLTDPLTGLINRRGIDKKLALWHNIPYTVLFIDIDHFKNINDAYGHDVGDITLQALATQMRLNFRPNDLLCRTGGEEFLIFLPMTTLNEAYHIAERFRQIVAHNPFKEIGHMTVSIGIASNKNSESFDELIKSADQALYRAKNAGRNQTIKTEIPNEEVIS